MTSMKSVLLLGAMMAQCVLLPQARPGCQLDVFGPDTQENLGILDWQYVPLDSSDGTHLPSWRARHCQRVESSGKKRAHKLKKNPRDAGRVSRGHPAGQTGVYRPVSRGLPVIYYRKTDRKGHFCRDTGRVSQGHPAIQEVFRKFM